jgi:predicted RecA/RadA family phage recombinase
MKNFVQGGDIITVTAPYALTSGAGCQVGTALFGVATNAADNGATTAELKTTGVFDITALSTDTGSAGARMYWDNTNKRLTTTSTSNLFVGVLTATKANGETAARIRLNGSMPV